MQHRLEELWNHTTGGGITCLESSYNGALSVVGSSDGVVYCFDTRRGLQWKKSMDGAVTSVAISSNGDLMATASEGKNVYLMDRQGTVQWQQSIKGPNRVRISADGARVFIGGGDKRFYIFDRYGTLIKKQKIGEAILAIDSSITARRVIISTDANFVYGFDNTGKLIWKEKAKETIRDISITGDGNSIVFACWDEKVHCLNGDGKSLWDYPVGKPVNFIRISSEGNMVVAGASDNTIYCIDRHGTLLWKQSTPEMVQGISVSDTGELTTACHIRGVDGYNNRGDNMFRHTTPQNHLNSVTLSRSNSVILTGSKEGNLFCMQLVEDTAEEYKPPTTIPSTLEGRPTPGPIPTPRTTNLADDTRVLPTPPPTAAVDPTSFDIEPGLSYIVEEDAPDLSFRVFTSRVEGKDNGMCITRRNPTQLRKSNPALESCQFIWLSNVRSDESVAPTDLEIINHKIKQFASAHEGSTVMMDGLEYLITHNNFKAVLKFIQSLVDYMAVQGATLVLTASPEAFDVKELKQLERDLELLNP